MIGNVVTRGLGGRTLITRGFGFGLLKIIWKNILRLTSKIHQTLSLVSKWRNQKTLQSPVDLERFND
jgi:hypothetical protein